MTKQRLSAKERSIMALLIAHRELDVRELVARSDGAIRRGTVYRTLQRMERKGLTASRPHGRRNGFERRPRCPGTRQRSVRCGGCTTRRPWAGEPSRPWRCTSSTARKKHEIAGRR